MGSLVVSFLVGILIACLISIFYFDCNLFYTKDGKYSTKRFILFIVVTVISLCGFIFLLLFSLNCDEIRNLQREQDIYINAYLQTDGNVGERAQIIAKLADINVQIDEKQKYADKWYGFDVPESVHKMKQVDFSELNK